MLQELRFAYYAIKKNIQSSAELRTSFITNVIGMFINNIAFIILWVFFVQSVGVINGWTATDIIALQGFAALCFGLIFSFGNGIRKLPEYVASGTFDHFMLSPKNLLMRVAVANLGVSSIGDVLFGVTCLALYAIFIQATALQIAFIVILTIITTLVFFAAVTMIYSMSFFFVDPASVTYGLFDLFVTPSLFHGGAIQGVMRFVFTFIIPSLLIGAIPVEILKSTSVPDLCLITALALIWVYVAIHFFMWVVKKYESSNFMTFGS